ncbi:hypothetical protein V2J09_014544 [Rumex salicifolius]
MMRTKTKLPGLSPLGTSSAAVRAGVAGVEPADADWEMRPGGMLVQKRDDSDQNSAPPPPIRVRVKYGSIYHEISISSQATFGELKKKLSGPTGLHHEDMKLLFKNKERDSKGFLDISGVKDKSKLVLMEDPISQEKRFLELRKTAMIEKAAKSVSQISLDVDRLAGRVSALESVISKGGKVPEKDVLTLTEQLMNELIKLDAIVANGDVKLQRKLQVTRVQKYVETLDLLKIKNATPTINKATLPKQQQQQQKQKMQSAQKPNPRTVVTTNWETFDSSATTMNHPSSPPPLIPLSPTSISGATHSGNQHKFSWDFFN